ncbi:MAG: hypothetical protein NT091_03950 [Candidatus Falkowbacteria bacterium]|nr:hypothetical protein [Candidatus Falkowbacteria bacterium]
MKKTSIAIVALTLLALSGSPILAAEPTKTAAKNQVKIEKVMVKKTTTTKAKPVVNEAVKQANLTYAEAVKKANEDYKTATKAASDTSKAALKTAKTAAEKAAVNKTYKQAVTDAKTARKETLAKALMDLKAAKKLAQTPKSN